MTQEDLKQYLQNLPKSPFGPALKQYLEERLFEIRDVTKYKTWKEAEGGQHAVRIIKDLFAFMEDKKTPEKKKSEYV